MRLSKGLTDAQLRLAHELRRVGVMTRTQAYVFVTGKDPGYGRVWPAPMDWLRKKGFVEIRNNKAYPSQKLRDTKAKRALILSDEPLQDALDLWHRKYDATRCNSV